MKMSFGYRSPIKKFALHCAYTGKKFSKELPPTFEHVLPKSKGGSCKHSNGLAIGLKINQKRSNLRFDLWLKKFPEIIKNIQKYLNELRALDVKVKNKPHVDEVIKTLNLEARGVATFKGTNRKMDWSC